MGGNTRAINRKTGETLAVADKIDFRVIPIHFFRHLLKQALYGIDWAVTVHKHPGVEYRGIKSNDGIWDYNNRHTLIENGYVLNGTSAHLFDKDGNYGKDLPIIKIKPVFGDIDVTVPRESLGILYDTLATLENKEVCPNVTYLGQNKLEQHGHQINALFQFHIVDTSDLRWKNDSIVENETTVNVQIDFEGVNYVNGQPDKFAKFAHSSSLDDLAAGIKGVAHKYWITNLVRATSEIPGAIVLTEKSPDPPEHRVKSMGSIPRLYAFSVDRGLRKKLRQVPGHDNIYRELSTDDSKYTTKLTEIFYRIFGVKPDKEDMEKFWSFTGLIELCEFYLDDKTVDKAFAYLLDQSLYGKGAQKLSRMSSDEDVKIKYPIVETLCCTFPYLRRYDSLIKTMSFNFYENY